MRYFTSYWHLLEAEFQHQSCFPAAVLPEYDYPPPIDISIANAILNDMRDDFLDDL